MFLDPLDPLKGIDERRADGDEIFEGRIPKVDLVHPQLLETAKGSGGGLTTTRINLGDGYK